MSDQKKKERIDVVDVHRYPGQSIQLPEGPPPMSIPDAMRTLKKIYDYEEEEIKLVETVAGFPWDVALAFGKAMQKLYGYTGQVSKTFMGMFGEVKIKPQEITVEVSHGEYVNAPWGTFELPGTEGATVDLGSGFDQRGRYAVSITAELKRKYTGMVKELAQTTRDILARESIYLGQAIKVDFCDADGNPKGIPDVQFIAPRMLDKSVLVFNKGIEAELADYVYGPLRYGRKEEYKRFGREFKRGVLLAGQHGTGKTLLTCRIAAEATDHGVTAIYIEDVKELPHALKFATTYLPAVIIGEDIDRAVTLDRDDLTNDIFNTIDGIDTKDHEIMLVVTTNNADKLHEGLLRPGRLDHRIFVELPDAEAIERLLWAYGKGQIGDGEKIGDVAEYLVGIKPSQVKNVIDRAKDGMARRFFEEGSDGLLTKGDLMIAAKNFKKEEDAVVAATVSKTEPRFGLEDLEFVKKESNGKPQKLASAAKAVARFVATAERGA